MALSANDAWNILADLSKHPQYQGLDGLGRLLNDTLATNPYAAPNGVSLFYSGKVGDLSSSGIAEAIAHASEDLSIKVASQPQMVSVLGQLEVGHVITSDDFQIALSSALKDAKLLATDSSVFMNGGVLSNGQTTPGLFDLISRNMAQQARGAVVSISPFGENGIWAKTEFPELLKNPNVTSINGIPIETLRAMNPEGALAVANNASEVLVSQLNIATAANASGGVDILVDTKNMFSLVDPGLATVKLNTIPATLPATIIPRTGADLMKVVAETVVDTPVVASGDAVAVATDVTAADSGYIGSANNVEEAAKGVKALESTLTKADLIKFAGKAGSTLGVLALSATYIDAVDTALKQADQGNTTAARNTMMHWTFETEGAMGAGGLVAEIASPLLAAGPAGWLAYGGAVLAAGALGAKAGGALWPSTDGGQSSALSLALARGPAVLNTDPDGSVWSTQSYTNNDTYATLVSAPPGVTIPYTSIYTANNGDGTLTQYHSNPKVNDTVVAYDFTIKNGTPVLQSKAVHWTEADGTEKQQVYDANGVLKSTTTVTNTPDGPQVKTIENNKDGSVSGTDIELFDKSGDATKMDVFDATGQKKSSEAFYEDGNESSLASYSKGIMGGMEESGYQTLNEAGVTTGVETFSYGAELTYAHYSDSGLKISLDMVGPTGMNTETFAPTGAESGLASYNTAGVEIGYGAYNGQGLQVSQATLNAAGKVLVLEEFDPASHRDLDIKQFNAGGSLQSLEGFDATGKEKSFDTYDTASGLELTHATYAVGIMGLKEATLATLGPNGGTTTLESFDFTGSEVSLAKYDTLGRETSLDLWNGYKTSTETFDPAGREAGLTNYNSVGVTTGYALFDGQGQEYSLFGVNPAGQITSQEDFNPATHTDVDLKLFNNGTLASIESYNPAGIENTLATYDSSGHETTLATFAVGNFGTVQQTTLATLDLNGGTVSFETLTFGQEATLAHYDTGGHETSLDGFVFGSKNTTELFSTSGVESGLLTFNNGVQTSAASFNPLGQETSLFNLTPGGQVSSQEDFNPATHTELDYEIFTTAGQELSFETFNTAGIENGLAIFDPASGKELTFASFIPGYNNTVQETQMVSLNPDGTTAALELFSFGLEASVAHYTLGQETSLDLYAGGYKSATETFGAGGLENGLTNYNSSGQETGYGAFNNLGQETSLFGVTAGLPSQVISEEDFNPASHIDIDLKTFSTDGVIKSLESFTNSGVENTLALFDPNGIESTLATFAPGYAGLTEVSLATLNPAGYTVGLESFAYGAETGMAHYNSVGQETSLDLFSGGYKNAVETFGGNGLENGLINYNSAGLETGYGNFNGLGQQTSMIGLNAAGQMVSQEDFVVGTRQDLDIKLYTDGVLRSNESFTGGVENTLASYDSGGHQLSLAVYAPGAYSGTVQETSLTTFDLNGTTSSYETLTFGQEATLAHYDLSGHEVSLDGFLMGSKTSTETFDQTGKESGYLTFNNGVENGYGIFNPAGQETSMVAVSPTGQVLSIEDFNPANHAEIDLKTFNSANVEISIEGFSAGVEHSMELFDPRTGLENSYATYVAANYGPPIETSLALINGLGVTVSLEQWNSNGAEVSLAGYTDAGQQISLDTFYFGQQTSITWNTSGIETGLTTYQSGLETGYGTFDADGRQTSLVGVDAGKQIVTREDFNPANHVEVDLATFNNGRETSLEGFNGDGREVSLTTFDGVGNIATLAAYAPVSGGSVSVETSLATLNTAGYTVSLEGFTSNGQEASMAHYDGLGHELSLDLYSGTLKSSTETFGGNGQESGLVNYNYAGQTASYATFNPTGQETSLVYVDGGGLPTSQIDYNPATHGQLDLVLYANGLKASREDFNGSGGEVGLTTFDINGHATTQAAYTPGVNGAAAVEDSLTTLNAAGGTVSLENFSHGQEASLALFDLTGHETSYDLFSNGLRSSRETFSAGGVENGLMTFNYAGQETGYANFNGLGQQIQQTGLDPATQLMVSRTDYNPANGMVNDVSTYGAGAVIKNEVFYNNGIEVSAQTYNSAGVLQNISTYVSNGAGGVSENTRANYNASGQQTSLQFISGGSVAGEEDFNPTTHAETNITGTVAFSNVSLVVAAGSTVTINGAGDSIVAGSGATVTFGSAGSDTVSATGATVVVSDNSQVSISGSNDTVYAGRNDVLNVKGNSDTVNANNGDRVSIGGTTDRVNASGATVTLNDNSQAEVWGSNNGVSAGSNDNLGVYGGGNTVNANAGDAVTLGIGSAAAALNVLNGSSLSLTVHAYSQVTLNGNNDQVKLDTGDSLLANGGGNAITAGIGNRVEVINTGGVFDSVNSNGNVFSGAAANSTAPGIFLDVNSQLNVSGSGNAISGATGDSLGVYGGANNISVSGNDLLVIGDTGGVADTIAAVNVLTGGATANLQGTGIFLNDGASAFIGGSNSTVTENGHNQVNLNTSNDVIYANGTADLNDEYGNGDVFYVSAGASVTNLIGATDQTRVTGTDDITDNYGSGDSSVNAGDHDRTNNFGPSDRNNNVGTYDLCFDIDPTSSNNNNGIASDRTLSNSQLEAVWVPFEHPPYQPHPEAFYASELRDRIMTFLGTLFGPGLAGTQATAAAAADADLAAIAANQWDGGNQLSAFSAQSELQQVQAAIAGGSAPAFSGLRWNAPVISWSLATQGNEFSGYLGDSAEAAARQAFATWGAASGLQFQQVADSTQSDIRIGAGRLDTADTGIVGSTMLHQGEGLLQPNSTITVEDSAQLALVAGADGLPTYAGTEVTLEQVLLHEIGHALGLADNADPASIESYALNGGNRTLADSDVAAIRALYAPVVSDPAALLQAMAALAPAAAAQTGVAAANDVLVRPLLGTGHAVAA